MAYSKMQARVAGSDHVYILWGKGRSAKAGKDESRRLTNNSNLGPFSRLSNCEKFIRRSGKHAVEA